jgi:tetratricopeptide (TPR) repeat protein
MTSKENFAEILDEYLRALEVGNPPDREALLARHPELEEELKAALLGIDFVHVAAPRLAPEEQADALPGRSLGDYRLLRELGRGGMAVVYEAEQVSLARRVALKVLPFAAVLDPKQLQRFKNEALAAAHLRHPNIVPVYGVGCDRGVHFYAMQYVDGQSLAMAIRDMKRGSTGEGPKSPISSHGSHREAAYIRMAAALGVQAAEALDHAHQLGIVHRDVKPGNLLADLAGTLWVTDFGLASSIKDVSLTITGELLGTLRYMSPEQALAKRAPVDHRTDVYSLGATLYELLTLEPAFPGDDVHRVMQNIALEEPVLPRRLNPALPRDLETVVLKAMSKDPGSRYATAQEMADDLTRFLENQPIEAKRPGLIRRAAKWSLRHRTLVAATVVLLLLSTAGLATGTALLLREQAETASALESSEANLELALKALDQIYVDEAEGHPQIRKGLPHDLLKRGLGFYQEFARQNAHNQDVAHSMGRAHHRASLIFRGLGQEDRAKEALDRAISNYREAIRLEPDITMAHLNLGTALDDKGDPDGAIASYREAIRLEPDLARAHGMLGKVLLDRGDQDGAIASCREAIRLEPDLARAHGILGDSLLAKGDPDGAIASYREALRLEPDYAVAHSGLGNALSRKGDPDGAIASHREALRLEPDYAKAHYNLGIALAHNGDPDGAIASFGEAIRLKPDFAEAHGNLGIVLFDKGDQGGAIASFRQAIRLEPGDARGHYNLGKALLENGDPGGAIASFREAIRLEPDFAEAHYNLGNALQREGDPDGAIAEYREAIRLEPDHAEAHGNLGAELFAKGDPDGAIAEFREVIRLAPGDALAHYNIGIALRDEGNPDGAIASFREAIRLEPDYADAHCCLGLALMGQGRYQEALPCLRRGHDLGSKRPDWAHPSKEWVEDAERKAELEGRLDQVPSGEVRRRDALERIELAVALHAEARHAESARMFADAFAEDAALAEDLAKGHRYNAARSAALAAANEEAGAAEWRGRALEWLRADLAAREKLATGLAEMLERWKKDPDFVSVRDSLGDLPGPERAAWRGFWAAVELALAFAPPAAK